MRQLAIENMLILLFGGNKNNRLSLQVWKSP